MLGNQIGEERGKVTGYRILPSEGAGPKVEVSFQSAGKILGVEHSTLGTYTSITRPDGSVFGEGQGVAMGAGGERASWVGRGLGKLAGRGQAISYRGALYYQSNTPKWAPLNGVVAVFEYEVDEQGNTTATLWEWK